MALSEHISISAKRSKKLQVEQHLFPLQPASAISLSQEVLPDTEQSHSGIVFVNLWQELSTFFIYIKKKNQPTFLAADQHFVFVVARNIQGWLLDSVPKR